MSIDNSSFQEKYDRLPKEIQGVVDLIVEWYYNRETGEKLKPEKTDKNSTNFKDNDIRQITNNSKNEDAEYTSVESFSLAGIKYDNISKTTGRHVNNWANILLILAEILNKKDSSKMNELASKSWKCSEKGKRPIICYGNYVRNPEIYKSIGNTKISICTNFSADKMKEIVFKLAEEFGYKQSDLIIYVRKKRRAVVEETI